MVPKPFESRLQNFYKKYSWASRFLLDQQLDPSEFDAVKRPKHESKTCLCLLWTKTNVVK